MIWFWLFIATYVLGMLSIWLFAGFGFNTGSKFLDKLFLYLGWLFWWIITIYILWIDFKIFKRRMKQ